MINAYLDRAAKPQAGGIMCVAASLFNPTPYKQFRRRWDAFLKGWGAPAFHATDFYPGGGDCFWRKDASGGIDPKRKARFDSDSQIVAQLVGMYSRESIVVSFKEQEFNAVAPQAWRDHFGTLPGVAAQMTTGAIGHWANRVRYSGEIAYFIESGQDGIEMEAALRRVYDNPEKRRHARMAASPQLVHKGKARGLEAADFVGWHWNKFYADHVIDGRNIRADLAAFMRMPETKVNAYLFSGQGLGAFLIENGCSWHPTKSAIEGDGSSA